MLFLSVLLTALAAGGPVYRPPHPSTPAQSPVTVPDERLSDDEVRARVANYLDTIDVPVTIDQWRALGPRAIPLLEQVLANRDGLPSRRAASVGGLAVIGGKRARELVLETARSDDEPFAVRAAALHGAPRVLKSRELVRELTPVLQGAHEPAVRAAAAEVLARHSPRTACAAIRAQAEREGKERDHFARALERCAAAR